MGLPLGPMLASLFLGYFKSKWLAKYRVQFRWKYYYCHVDVMLKNIKCTCTCEVENENKVYFLDVTVTKEEVALTALFKRKPVVVYI